MSNVLLKLVYSNVKATTPTEQSVLAALAFCANEKTGKCFPTATTLHAMTHFGESTVEESIKKLGEKGYISWITGGCGTRSNSYKFNLPLQKEMEPAKKPNNRTWKGGIPSQLGVIPSQLG